MTPIKITALVLGLFIATNNLMAQDNYSLSTQTVTINGTSNLHNWSERVEKISGKGDVKQASDKSISLETLNIIVQVNSIKSDESGMITRTYKALKGDKYPEITLTLTEPVANIPYGANAYPVSAKGRLTIAGVTRPIIIPVKITCNGDKKIIIDGVQQIKMTDYGIDPPTALLGMLKTRDIVTINFKTSFSSLN
ncbi:MAG TPA: YceI family protein [Mucilaginibacter sp.]